MIENPNTNREKIRLHFYIPVILYITILAWISGVLVAEISADRVMYTIVDTAQIRCHINTMSFFHHYFRDIELDRKY